MFSQKNSYLNTFTSIILLVRVGDALVYPMYASYDAIRYYTVVSVPAAVVCHHTGRSTRHNIRHQFVITALLFWGDISVVHCEKQVPIVTVVVVVVVVVVVFTLNRPFYPASVHVYITISACFGQLVYGMHEVYSTCSSACRLQLSTC